MTRYEQLIASQQLPAEFHDLVERAYRPVAAGFAARRRDLSRPLVAGVCGAQGTGKSTMASFLEALLHEEHGLRAAIVSLDDLYLPRERREELARDVHPLLATRGVPGTHEVSLGIALIEGLTAEGANPVAVPRFDKAADTRLPSDQWPRISPGVDVVLLEGWCVGARPQPPEELIAPINPLEREQDPDGRWRRHVNECLAGEYQRLFGRIDVLVMLEAPSFEAIYRWRSLQERKLASRVGQDTNRASRNRVMSEQQLRIFLMHYERLTRHMLQHMPAHADMVLELDENHSLSALKL